MNRKTIELLDCPFCGGPAAQPEGISKTGSRPIWEIHCNWCFIALSDRGMAVVVRRWNTRKGAEAVRLKDEGFGSGSISISTGLTEGGGEENGDEEPRPLLKRFGTIAPCGTACATFFGTLVSLLRDSSRISGRSWSGVSR